MKNDSNSTNKILYLLGNNIESPHRAIAREKSEEMAESLDIKYFEVCCKINLNVQEVIERMIVECYMKLNQIDKIDDKYFNFKLKFNQTNKKLLKFINY